MSSSSEFVDSGRFSRQRQQARAPEKSSSSFSQTCNLLSQYLKEKGTFVDLGLGMTTSFEAKGSSTMNLFPVAEKSGEVPGISIRNAASMSPNLTSMELFPLQSGFASNFSMEKLPKEVDSRVTKSGPETAQMTIFYAGQVIVFNDFPEDKAKEVMLLAGKGSPHNPATAFASTQLHKPVEPTRPTPTTVVPNFGNDVIQEPAQRPPQPYVSDLPIARKASLTRFLEKRKDRIIARAPYNTSNSDSTSSPPKPAESKPWLGLSAQSPPLQLERQI
ncbi:hypothetical protein U1Q18_028816 [Sarracenia purpurea var. burkii]